MALAFSYKNVTSNVEILVNSLLLDKLRPVPIWGSFGCLEDFDFALVHMFLECLCCHLEIAIYRRHSNGLKNCRKIMIHDIIAFFS